MVGDQDVKGDKLHVWINEDAGEMKCREATYYKAILVCTMYLRMGSCTRVRAKFTSEPPKARSANRADPVCIGPEMDVHSRPARTEITQSGNQVGNI